MSGDPPRDPGSRTIKQHSRHRPPTATAITPEPNEAMIDRMSFMAR
ncbi:hypothetical protein NHJ13734_006673 [Beauveria thailandica]